MNEERLPRVSADVEPDAAWLASALPSLVAAIPAAGWRRQRWFAGKAQRVEAVAVRDAVAFGGQPPAALALVDVALGDGSVAVYFLPLAVRRREEAVGALEGDLSAAFLGLASPGGVEYLLYDASADAEFARETFRHLEAGRRLPARRGTFAFANTGPLAGGAAIESIRRLRGEQSNTSVVFGRRYILKYYRRLQNGRNPDLEVPRFLTTRTAFRHTPLLAGYVEYEGTEFGAAIGSLQAFVANAGDGWRYTLDHLGEFYGGVRLDGGKSEDADAGRAVREAAGDYLRDARRLGEVTGELHCALSSDATDPAFAPEPVEQADLERWVAGAQEQLTAALALARAAAARHPLPLCDRLRAFVAAEPLYRRLTAGLLALAGAKVVKIRHHGDYHLGQTLRTADGFVVLDFEGEPARPLAERRAKHLALRDVAGMLRSFDYARHAGLPVVEEGRRAALERYGRLWEDLASEAFLAGYFARARGAGAPLLPPSDNLAERAIAFFTLEKAVYELMYELNNRPSWLHIPLQYLIDLQASG